MDQQALSDLHGALQAQGFSGQLDNLRVLLEKSEADTEERRVLTWWKTLYAPMQYAALTAVYAHARKHKMTISTYDQADRVSLVLSRTRSFLGVCLGRVEVTKQDVRWCFYKGNEFVGERVRAR